MNLFDRNVQESIQRVGHTLTNKTCKSFRYVLVAILGPLKGGLNKKVTEIVM